MRRVLQRLKLHDYVKPLSAGLVSLFSYLLPDFFYFSHYIHAHDDHLIISIFFLSQKRTMYEPIVLH